MPTGPGEEMRRGVRLGVDVGKVRVGVAVCDPDGLLATPLVTLARDTARGSDVAELARLADEHEVLEIVVGLPRTLSGQDGPAAQAARGYARALARAVRPLPVRLVDERLSTVAAQRGLHAAGRTVRSSRAVVDQAAAVVILQSALDTERNAGRPPGHVMEADK